MDKEITIESVVTATGTGHALLPRGANVNALSPRDAITPRGVASRSPTREAAVHSPRRVNGGVNGAAPTSPPNLHLNTVGLQLNTLCHLVPGASASQLDLSSIWGPPSGTPQPPPSVSASQLDLSTVLNPPSGRGPPTGSFQPPLSVLGGAAVAPAAGSRGDPNTGGGNTVGCTGGSNTGGSNTGGGIPGGGNTGWGNTGGILGWDLLLPRRSLSAGWGGSGLLGCGGALMPRRLSDGVESQLDEVCKYDITL